MLRNALASSFILSLENILGAIIGNSNTSFYQFNLAYLDEKRKATMLLKTIILFERMKINLEKLSHNLFEIFIFSKLINNF